MSHPAQSRSLQVIARASSPADLGTFQARDSPSNLFLKVNDPIWAAPFPKKISSELSKGRFDSKLIFPLWQSKKGIAHWHSEFRKAFLFFSNAIWFPKFFFVFSRDRSRGNKRRTATSVFDPLQKISLCHPSVVFRAIKSMQPPQARQEKKRSCSRQVDSTPSFGSKDGGGAKRRKEWPSFVADGWDKNFLILGKIQKIGLVTAYYWPITK